MTIFHPLLGMVVLTLLVAIQLLYFNTWAVLIGEVHIKHFRLFDAGIPLKLQSVAQHYKNMFEILSWVLALVLQLLVNGFILRLGHH